METLNLIAARALLHEGLCVIPTAGDGEKRPFGKWREYMGRMPSEEEIAAWFVEPRPGGVVCGKVSGGVEVIDLDTVEGYEAFEAKYGGTVPCERSPHGGHAWYRCDEAGRNSRPADKVDTRGEGGFCVVYDPAALTRHGVPRVTPQLRREMLDFASGGGAAAAARPAAAPRPSDASLRAALIAHGWRSLGVKGDGREHFSRPGAAHPDRTDATLSPDGSGFKVWSTSALEPPPVAEPVVLAAKEVVAAHPSLPEAVLPFVRRGSFALVSADPKAGKTVFALRTVVKACARGMRVVYADLENGPALWAHRLMQHAKGEPPERLMYLDCREHPNIGYIAAGIEAAGGCDLLVIDPWGLLIAGDGVEDESSNAMVAAYVLRLRDTLRPFDCATVILHHTPKSGAKDKLCFAGAGASSLQRYVQSICRIRDDGKGAFWFEALCREFDEPFKPVMVRRK